MPIVGSTLLPHDAGSRYFTGPWDTATDTGLGQRAFNVDLAHGVGDGGVVLVDHLNNPLLVRETLADGMAGLSTARVGAAGMVWNGATWDRQKGDNTGVVRTSLYGKGTVAGDTAVDVSTTGADGVTNTVNALRVSSRSSQYNGTTWDRQVNNTEGTLLASAARTVSTASANQTNYNARGVIIVVNCTAKAVATTLQFYVGAIDALGGGAAAWIARSAAGITLVPGGQSRAIIVIYPGIDDADLPTPPISSVNTIYAVSMPLPRTWVFQVNHSDANSITYSAQYQYIV